VHEIQQRTAKWLLETHDRVEGDEFQLTQEFLADMLGVTYRRGTVVVLDRPRLEESSCECYAVVRDEYVRLMSG
jgi:hypothetical protein